MVVATTTYAFLQPRSNRLDLNATNDQRNRPTTMAQINNTQSNCAISLNHSNLERPITKMQNIPDLMASLAGLDENTVIQIRKTAESPPRVSVIDVIILITGASRDESAHIHRRLCEAFPDVSTFGTNFKFSGQGQRNTPVADAVGITQIVLLLPGRAAAAARQSAAGVIVRYLGGDVSLVAEIMANHATQAELESDDPAAFFGQSLPPGPTPHEIEMAANSRLQTLGAAYQLAQAIGSTSSDRLRVAAQQAIDNVLLPPGDTMDQYVDAATILRERAYTWPQIARLAGELGKDLKQVAKDEGRITSSNEQNFGPECHQVGVYHRVRDAGLIEDVLRSFRKRQLYQQTMAGIPAPSTQRRIDLLDQHGRGRKRQAHTHEAGN